MAATRADAAPYHRRHEGPALRLPLLVVVSGVPGGGKTTLAGRLSAELLIPHLNRDLVSGGRWVTDGVRDGERAWDAWLAATRLYVDARISCVIDQTMYRGRSDATIRRELAPHALVVNVHVHATNARERWEAKIHADARNDDVAAVLARWDTVVDEVSHPMDFGGALILVDTFDPTFPGCHDAGQRRRRRARPGLTARGSKVRNEGRSRRPSRPFTGCRTTSLGVGVHTAMGAVVGVARARHRCW
jgi:hypothetical protein